MTSIFAKIEEEIVNDVEEAAKDIEEFFVSDVWPIIKAVLHYIEENGEADLLLIGKSAFTSAAAEIAAGGDVVDVTEAALGTALDKAKSAGLTVAKGAAILAISMAAAEFNTKTGK